MVTALSYAPVRKAEDDNKEFILSTEARPDRGMVEEHVKECEKKVPSWAKANPVQRIVPVRITELPS